MPGEVEIQLGDYAGYFRLMENPGDLWYPPFYGQEAGG
jgi:hypothetical protein